MSRKVIFARLQTTAHIPSVGNLENTFPPASKNLKDLDMVTTPDGLSIKFNYMSVKKELLVPFANIILMELAPEEKKAVK